MSSHRAVTLGLAGTGRIGTSHAETLSKLPNVATVLVADADADRARATATHLGVEFAPDLDTLFAADLDGLIIATATDSHPQLITRAVDAGIPVFCEKPVAADIEGTLAVIDHIRNSPSQSKSASNAASTSATTRRVKRSDPANSAGCTLCAPPPSTRRRHPPTTSHAPAASSATAESTISTSSAG